MNKCFVCGFPCECILSHADEVKVRCSRCGEFSFSGTAKASFDSRQPDEQQCANLSAWLSRNSGTQVRANDLDRLLALKAPSPHNRALAALSLLGRRTPKLGDEITVSKSEDELGPWLAASWSSTYGEVQFIFHSYLAGAMQAVDVVVMNDAIRVRLLPKGYELLERGDPAHSNSGFCAMWFDDSVEDAWTKAIQPAIEGAGWEAVRVDAIQHVRKIDDEIIAAIRRARFVVADFTGQRGGVYFEAGFAMGLGIPVIWSCREDHISDLHFDIRQYNMLTWKADDLVDFRKSLSNRIEAILGRGPLARVSAPH